ncbi:MAG: class I SAM-dependent RNA methyltransferase, partial [Burkholderiales bacterium]
SSAIPDAAFYAEFASTLKKHFAGWRVALISNDMNLPRQLRLQPKRKTPVFNGALECRLFIFDMIAGSNRKD